MQISLDDGTVRHLDVHCAAVVSWGDQQLFFTSGGTALPFTDFDELVADRLALGHGAFLPLAASAGDGDALHSLAEAGDQRTIWRITLKGDAASATRSSPCAGWCATRCRCRERARASVIASRA